MPFRVRKVGRKKFAIVNKRTGKVVGHSRSRRKAYISAYMRMKGEKR